MTIQTISRREYTAADVKQIDLAERQLSKDHPEIVKDLAGMTEKIDIYFQTNRQVPVTLENIYRVVGLSSAEAEWFQTAHQNPELASQVANYVASTTGRPGSIVKNGDPLFENLLLLFNELQSRREFLTPQTIAAAKNRIASRPGRQLRRIPEPRREGPRSEAAKNDDPNRKPGQFISEHINEPEWARRSRERSEREAREAASQQSDASVRSRVAAEARSKAESIQTPSAAETDQLRKLFITISGSSEINWPETLAARERLQQQFTKAREVRRFIR